MFSKSFAVAGLLAASLFLTSCASSSSSADSHQHSDMGGHSMTLSSAEVMFAQMMIPHHQQAVDMGTLAETRASSQPVKELAAQIKAEQHPEVDQMKHWLEDAGAALDMGHEMHMTGMLTEAEMQELSNASGVEFDRLYLEGMILHHEGAIEMAKTVINSSNSEVKKLAEHIVSSQTEQINYMRELLAK